MTSLITRADRARDIRQWVLAARLYRKALNRNSKNPPIWLQYGHALKESGKLTEAEQAYRVAIDYQPGDADAHLHLGHVLKLQGKRCDAEAAYLRALAIDPMLPEPLEELGRLGWSNAHLAELKQAARPKRFDRDEVTALLSSTPAPEPEALHPRADSNVDPMLWFFVGDTIDWLQSHVQLTGVGKVTVELFLASLDRDSEQQAFPCVLDNAAKDLAQLALVGREDLTIAELDEGIASLVKTSKIVVLQGLADAELAGLYRQCLFTAFPSLSEGYGLPVAESLQHGKLCISSDLPVIREHAGDLPWYFNPADDATAYELFPASPDRSPHSPSTRRTTARSRFL